jgi:wobble nucleotide-excising tRNase
MLKSFKVIRGVGAFKNFENPKSKVEFAKNTIIYALNGYGKTTIAAILKSLGSRDSTKILERKSLQNANDAVIEQEIVLSYVNSTASSIYKNGWKHNGIAYPPEILVFDQQFVYDNLFVQRVESGHKQSIHTIVIGAEGLSISKELTIAKEREKQLKKLFDDKQKELEKRQKLTNRDDYLVISDSENDVILVQLENIKRQIEAKNEEEKLRGYTSLGKLVCPELKPDFLKIYNLSFSSIHDEAEQLVKAHISRHTAKPELADTFLRQALEQTLDTCPFCGQNLESAHDLLDAYRKYFDQSHRDSLEMIKTCLAEINQWNPRAELLQLESKYAKAKDAVENFRKYVDVDQMSQPDFSSFIRKFESLKEKVQNTLEQKLHNINLSQSDDEALQLDTIFCDLKGEIEVVNQTYRRGADSIKAYLASISGSTSSDLNILKSQLEKSLKRFSQDEKNWCKDYQELESEFHKITLDIKTLTNKLASYSTTVFHKYQASVNDTLNELGVDFRLDRFIEQVDNRSKQPYAEFQIVINETQVPLQVRGDNPCFHNTLSEGEKNTLSLAFFVNWLKNQPNLDKKVVVFDDPLSSLDEHRKNLTARLIRDLSDSIGQAIILTHNKDFLFLLCDNLSGARTLTLKKDRIHGSCLSNFDVTEHRKNLQQKRIESLETYLEQDHCSTHNAQEMIRLCLETALQFKYFRHLRSKNITTLGKMIDELKNLGKLDSAIIRTLRDLNDISSPIHHGESGNNPLKEITRNELLPDIRKTLELLEKI